MSSARIAGHEQRAGRLLGGAHVVAFGYARHALTAILGAQGLVPGDQVALAPLTCRVVPLALLAAGFRPVYADIDPDTLNLDAKALAAAVTSRTRAILFQHTYGNPEGVEAIAVEARSRGLPLVEDCAQSVPIHLEGWEPGSHGAAAIFSNNLLKPLPAASGGIAVVQDAELAARIAGERDRLPAPVRLSDVRLRIEAALQRRLLTPSRYWFALSLLQRVSASYRDRPLPEEIATEITRTAVRPSAWQLREGDRWLERATVVARGRRALIQGYLDVLTGLPGLRIPLRSALPLYYLPVLVGNKRELLARARRERVEVVAWPGQTAIYPVNDIQHLGQYGYAIGSCPEAERVAARLVGLPTHPGVKPADQARIVSLVRAFGA
jgi:perosamine synthetase